MITIDTIADLPEIYHAIEHNDDGTINVIFDDDMESELFEVSKIERRESIKQQYKSAEKNLSVDKKTYDDLLAASVADVKYKDKDKNQVKADFKAAVEARNLLIDKRDALIDQINTATTIEEVEAIVW